MKRLYEQLIKAHFKENNLMFFLSGPRQVGKTTTSCEAAQQIADKVIYLNWDNEDHRSILLEGPAAIFHHATKEELVEESPIIVFDEIHKRPDWKNFLKGFYDSYSNQVRIIVTGSSRLDIHKKGGDSLMGRYFPNRMHPLSVGECLITTLSAKEIRKPKKIEDSVFENLWKYGGFPKPFEKCNSSFHLRWQRLREQQLLREDIRDDSVIQDINKLEILAKMIMLQASQQITYSSLAKKVRISVDTVARWIEILQSFYYCFLIRPWSRNIAKSLIKEPKVFLWDWSRIQDPGAKAENFVASHLLKAVHLWTDLGLGEYELYYIRDTLKREVDFVVTKNDEPWFLVEVKNSANSGVSKSLYLFQEMTQAPHAFQVVLNKPFVNKDCFTQENPIIVPAKTLLSQLP